MKQIKVSEASGAVLDWLVAKCEGNVKLQYDSRDGLIISNILGWIPYRPSVAWQQGGPIIERERISIVDEYVSFRAGMTNPGGQCTGVGLGPTHLIAAMRCYVISKLGETVEVPEELA